MRRALAVLSAITVLSLPGVTNGANASPGMSPLLRRIGGCESSGRPHGPLIWTQVEGAHRRPPRSTASGAFQVLDGTWAGHGGYRRAMHAPPAVQVDFAQRLMARHGTAPWRASRGCWS